MGSLLWEVTKCCFMIGFAKANILTKGENKFLRTIKISLKRIVAEPRREKTGFLHMRKQRRRSASR